MKDWDFKMNRTKHGKPTSKISARNKPSGKQDSILSSNGL